MLLLQIVRALKKPNILKRNTIEENLIQTFRQFHVRNQSKLKYRNNNIKHKIKYNMLNIRNERIQCFSFCEK